MTSIIKMLIHISLCGFTYGIYPGLIESRTESPLWLLQENNAMDTKSNGFNEMVPTKSSHKTRHGHGRKAQRKSCCENGGLCILGSFCQCPKNYHGRYCEQKIADKNCDTIPHGTWIRSDCDLCHCYQGEFTCIPRIYPGCDESEPLDLTVTIDPMKGKDIQVLQRESHVEGLTVTDYDYTEDYNSYYANHGILCKPLLMSTMLLISAITCLFSK